MSDLIRDATIGQIIRFVTNKRYLKYPEEKPDWKCPCESYQADDEKKPKLQSTASGASTVVSPTPQSEKDHRDLAEHHHNVLTTAETRADLERPSSGVMSDREMSRITSRQAMNQVTSRADLETAYADAIRQETIKEQASRPIEPSMTADGRTLVDWYRTDDPENPQNWSRAKKNWVVFQIYIYTLGVYMGGAIFTPSIPYIVEELHVSPIVASLGLSMYVLGYGIGPLIFSPMSEIPIIGRNPPYIVTFFIFIIISVPTAFVNNFPALVVLRFLQGFFGSPCLATGGATIGDLVGLLELPYYLCGWAAFATCGPALGPMLSGFAVPAKNWHWSLYEILWLASPIFVSLFFFLPETSSQTILLRRASRLRKATGNKNLVSQSEIDQAKLSVNEVVVGNLWRPIQINALDPAVLFTSLYIGLLYGIFYSFFEVFPLVYGAGLPGSATQGYGMNLGEQGLIFLSVSVAVAIAIVIYASYLHWSFNPDVRANGLGAPERRLIPGLYASFAAPIGLFIYAWTANDSPRIHWIVPTIGVTIFMMAVFILFQVIFIYIPMTYPQYAASLFAGNDFARSAIAAGAIHFANPLFHNLGIGRGVSLLGGLMFFGVIGVFTLWRYGAKLRGMSKFAVK